MQISIEQHNTVMAGLVTEMEIIERQRQDAVSDLEDARNLIRASDGAVETYKAMVSKVRDDYERKLSRITTVALLGVAAVGNTPIDEPEWSSALEHVQCLSAQAAKRKKK